MSGLEVLRALRSGETLARPETLTIVYTATASSEFVQTCEDMGADGVFLKPQSFAQLRRKLEKMVAAKNAETAGQTNTHGQQHPADLNKNAMPCPQKENLSSRADANTAQSHACESAVWNRNAALEALDNDAEVFKSLVAVLAGELHERLAALDAALADADEELLRRTAHACKNSAGIMRLDQLRAAATAAEVAETSHLPDAARALRKAMIEASLVLAAEQNQEQAD